MLRVVRMLRRCLGGRHRLRCIANGVAKQCGGQCVDVHQKTHVCVCELAASASANDQTPLLGPPPPA